MSTNVNQAGGPGEVPPGYTPPVAGDVADQGTAAGTAPLSTDKTSTTEDAGLFYGGSASWQTQLAELVKDASPKLVKELEAEPQQDISEFLKLIDQATAKEGPQTKDQLDTDLQKFLNGDDTF